MRLSVGFMAWTPIWIGLVLTVSFAHGIVPQGHDPEDQDSSIFIRLEEGGEGAPSKAGLGKVVIVTDLRPQDERYSAVKLLASARNAEVVASHPWDGAKVFKRLATVAPEFVIAVLDPSTIDVNFHFEFLERAAKLDQDPFVDFTFGYVTGATAAELIAFAKGMIANGKRRVARRILEFGPSTSPASMTKPLVHPWAKGFTKQSLAHPPDDPKVAETLANNSDDVGILSAWGHGMPDGIDQGLKGAHVRAVKQFDLSSHLYFSGPCYGGVVERWFNGSSGTIEASRVDPEASFLLALVGARAAGIFAGLDPDRGETNHHELEHLLTTGNPLGYATKSTYDDVVLAYRRSVLELPRYVPGKGRPHRNLAERMIAGGACRALFGDPTWTPVSKAGESPFEGKLAVSSKGVTLEWSHDANLGQYWLPVDIYRADGGWTHRLRFRSEISREVARKLRRLESASAKKDGKDLTFIYPSAALEVWGGKAFLHALLVFPRKEKDHALSGARHYGARFYFTR